MSIRNSLWSFTCTNCGTENRKRADAMTGPNLRETVKCVACGETAFFPEWQEVSYEDNQFESNTEGRIVSRYVTLMDMDKQEEQKEENKLLRQRIVSLEAEKKTTDKKLQENERKIDQFKQLVNLMSLRDEVRSKRNTKNIEERIAEIDIKIAELADVVGWKFQNR